MHWKEAVMKKIIGGEGHMLVGCWDKRQSFHDGHPEYVQGYFLPAK